MKTEPSRFLVCVSCCWLVLSPGRVHADPAVQRMLPPAVAAGEGIGADPHSTAIGSGFIAVGSKLAKNRAGVDTGGVYVFDEKSGNFLFSLFPADGVSGDQFGAAVAISGNRLAVGAPKHDTVGLNTGTCYVFDLKTRAQTFKLTGFLAAGEEGGSAVALDGDVLAVGAPKGNLGAGPGTGFVVVWNLAMSLGLNVTNPTPVNHDAFGTSVALHGKLLAVGVPGDDTAAANAGAVQLFDATTNQFITQLVAGSPVAADGIGWDVDLDRNTVAASGPLSNDGAAAIGKACSWSIASVTTPFSLGSVRGTAAGLRFGDALSVEDGLVVVSEPLLTSPSFPFTARTGGVHVFDRNLRRVQTIQPATLPAGGGFGASLCLAGTTLVASVPGDGAGAPLGGSAWKMSPLLMPSALRFSRIIGTVGDPTPGGGSFSGFPVVAGTGGDPVMLAGLTGAGTVEMNTALFAQRGVDVHMTRVALAGNPPGGARIRRFTDLVAHSVDFFARVQRTGPGVTPANAESWRFYGTGLESTVLQNGYALPLGTVRKLGQLRMSNYSLIATIYHTLTPGTGVPAVTAASDTAFSIVNGGSYAGTIREGVTNSPLGNPYGQFPPTLALMGDKTAGVFVAQLGGAVTTANNVFIDDNGVLTFQRKGDIAPAADGSPLFPWRNFLAVVRCNTSLAFRGVMNTTASKAEGLWTNRTGATRLVLRQGDPAPGMATGQTIRRFISMGMNDGPTILTLVQLAGPGITSANDLVLYGCIDTGVEPGLIEVLVREGNRLPGGAKVGTIHSLDLVNVSGFSNSHYGVLATLANEKGVVTPSDNLAWLVGSIGNVVGTFPVLRQPSIVLRKGALSQGIPGRERIASLALPCQTTEANGTFNSGLSHALGQNFGRSTLKVTYPDKKQSIVVID